MQTKKIIVMQTHYGAEEWCRKALLQLGMDEHEFTVEGDSFSIESHIVPNVRQLFITGSFSGNTAGLGEFVSKLRKKNKQLIVASYSSNGVLPGPFDLHIPKNRDDGGFENTVKDFLSGKLQQVPDHFWHPSPKLIKKLCSGKIKRKFVVICRNTDTLAAIKQSIASIYGKRAEEIFFTQNPHAVVAFVGQSATAVVITTDLFREELDVRQSAFGGPSLPYLLSNIRRKKWFGFTNTVLRYGSHPEPDADLQGVIKRPQTENADRAKHLLLAEIIAAFPEKPKGRGTDGLLKEIDALAEKFPAIDQWSCIHLRPASL